MGVSFYAASAYYDDEHNAFYNYVNSNTNHAVNIVGWDDNFPKEYFGAGSQKPDNNGAWLVRNSWTNGDVAADNELLDYSGYFWMSYEDSSLSEAAYVFEVDSADNYDNNYYYTNQIYIPAWFNVLSKFANTFEINGENETSKERIDAVIIQTEESGVTYSISVYKVDNAGKPTEPITDDYEPTTGTLVYPGIYTIPLTETVTLDRGSKFAIVVETQNGPICCECEYKQNDSFDISVTANAGESFFYYGSSWYDFTELYDTENNRAYGNFCIQALTTDIGIPANQRVKGLKYTARTQDSVSLSWDAYDGAEAYAVYRALNTCAESDFVRVASGVTGTAYTDSEITTNSLCYYRVVPIINSAEAMNLASNLLMVALKPTDDLGELATIRGTGTANQTYQIVVGKCFAYGCEIKYRLAGYPDTWRAVDTYYSGDYWFFYIDDIAEENYIFQVTPYIDNIYGERAYGDTLEAAMYNGSVRDRNPVLTTDFGVLHNEDQHYTGREHEATIQNAVTDIGTITIYYANEGSETWTTEKPVNADTYLVAVDITESTLHNAVTKLTAENWKLVIQKTTLNVIPDDSIQKEEGDDDPELTYTYSGNIESETPGFTGKLTRESGETMGQYIIHAGTLALADNGTFLAANYDMNFYDNYSSLNIYAVDFDKPVATLVSKDKHSVKFKWDAIRKAEGYAIYDDSGELIGKTTELTYEITGLDADTGYTFSIYPYRSSTVIDVYTSKHGTFSVNTDARDVLSADDFSFTAQNVTYDGQPHGATVTSKISGVTVSGVYYADENDTSVWATDKPVNAGNYLVAICTDETEDYEATDKLGNAAWKFTVSKATDAPLKPATALECYFKVKKVGDVGLPNGWAWSSADTDREFGGLLSLKAVAEYVNTDKDNYVNINVEITITKTLCQHDSLSPTAAKDAKCTEEGNTAYWKCLYCGKYFSDEGHTEIEKDSWITEALGHDYVISYVWSTDGKQCTAKAVCKHDEKHVVTETVTTEDGKITHIIKKEASTTAMGVTEYTATFQNELFKVQTTEITDIPKLDEPEVTNEPEISGAPEVTGEPEVSGAPEVTGEPEVSGAPEVTGEPEISGAPENTDEPEVSGVPETTDEPVISGAPEATDEPETTDEPEISGAPETTDEPEISGAPETTDEPGTSESTERPILVGDVDNDGSITPKDVTLLRRHLAGGWNVKINELNADIDKDGSITPKDVTRLRRYLAGGWGIVLN